MSSRPTWDETWIEVARTVAKRSLCSRDQVGAVVVSRTNRILETGYNGPPAGFSLPDLPCKWWCERSGRAPAGTPLSETYADCVTLHAEQNALMFGDRAAREGGTIYVTSNSCATCAKLIANSGLETAVIDLRTTPEYRRDTKWVEFMEKCGLTVVIL